MVSIREMLWPPSTTEKLIIMEILNKGSKIFNMAVKLLKTVATFVYSGKKKMQLENHWYNSFCSMADPLMVPKDIVSTNGNPIEN